MDEVQKLLPRELKDLATAAFRDNRRRDQMTPEQREASAQAYEQISELTIGINADLARLYNLEHAKFLRGEIEQIEATARQFGERIRYDDAL